MSTTNDASNKLGMLFKPMLDEAFRNIKEYIASGNGDILIAISRVESRIDVLEKLVGGIKKPAARGEKKATATDGVVVDGAPATAPVAADKKTFAVNKLVYFREQFKTDAAYRNRYVDAELEEIMSKDPTISSKTADAAKLVAKATFCWNYFKVNKPEVAKAIEVEYLAAKNAHENVNKPEQQAAEAHTPTEA